MLTLMIKKISKSYRDDKQLKISKSYRDDKQLKISKSYRDLNQQGAGPPPLIYI